MESGAVTVDNAAANVARHEFVYLILAHGQSPQLTRLMQTIRFGSPHSAIVLHHDAKSIVPEEAVLHRLGVRLVEPRVSVNWGEFTLVEAVLNSISYTMKIMDFDWLVIISGQDYPLRPLSMIEKDLRVGSYDAYIKSAPVDAGPYGFRYYMQYRPLPKFRYGHRIPTWMRRIARSLHGRFIQRSRWLRIQPGVRDAPSRLGIRSLNHPFSDAFVCQKGSQWFTLSSRAARYLVQFGRANPGILHYYRNTLIPDESYFSTVICNAEFKVDDDHRRFILWDEAKTAHPVTLTMQHLDAMISSGKDFGRKFDAATDSNVLDALDQVVLGSKVAEA